MIRDTLTSRDLKAGCFSCHGTAVYLSIRYGIDAGDDRQIDIEDAIASASSGGRPDAAPLTDPDAPADAPAGVSAPEGRPVETRRHMPRGARGRKPETANA